MRVEKPSEDLAVSCAPTGQEDAKTLFEVKLPPVRPLSRLRVVVVGCPFCSAFTSKRCRTLSLAFQNLRVWLPRNLPSPLGSDSSMSRQGFAITRLHITVDNSAFVNGEESACDLCTDQTDSQVGPWLRQTDWPRGSSRVGSSMIR